MTGEIEDGYAFDPYSSGGVLLARARAEVIPGLFIFTKISSTTATLLCFQ